MEHDCPHSALAASSLGLEVCSVCFFLALFAFDFIQPRPYLAALPLDAVPISLVRDRGTPTQEPPTKRLLRPFAACWSTTSATLVEALALPRKALNTS